MKHSFNRIAAALGLMFATALQGAEPAADLTQAGLQAFWLRDVPAMREVAQHRGQPMAEAMQVVLLIKDKKTDAAEKALEQVLKTWPQDAELHFFAAPLWREIGRQRGMFSALGYAKRQSETYIKAAQLAPENPLYAERAASARGFDNSLFSVNLNAQRQALDALKPLSARHALIAEMDWQQNVRKSKPAIELARSALKQFPEDARVIERAAQLFWTFDEPALAQAAFAQACALPVPGGWDLQEWQKACWLAGQLANDGDGDLHSGRASLARLLQEDATHDDEWRDAERLLQKIDKRLQKK